MGDQAEPGSTVPNGYEWAFASASDLKLAQDQYGWLENADGERTYQVAGGSRLDVGERALPVLYRDTDRTLFPLLDSYVELAGGKGVETQRDSSALLTRLESMTTDETVEVLQQVCGSDGCQYDGLSGEQRSE